MPSSDANSRAKPKYRVLLDSLIEDIRSERFKAGDKLPSESALVKKFATSRITVGRALRELQHLGLVHRVGGSGTFVLETKKEPKSNQSLLFGLLIPDLGETEVFEAICNGISQAGAASDHALLWGHGGVGRGDKGEQARDLCRQYIARKVSGVFFAPLEFELDADKTNRAVLAALRNAAIPVVLLDHRPAAGSEARRHDVVGLNNKHAGYIATEHLIELGAKRIGFLGYHGAPSTIAERISGYEAALKEHDLAPPGTALGNGEKAGRTEYSTEGEIEGWVCINDRVAAQLMQSLSAARVRIPEDVRIVGIDDASYATLLSVPLTTVRQPSRELGEAALTMMLDRIKNVNAPARDLLLDGELIVRDSCGAKR